MGIYMYERTVVNGQPCFRNRTKLKLGGHGPIYAAWLAKGRRCNQLWHATADDLLREATGGAKSSSNAAILFDLAPRRDWSIEMLELRDLYAFTHAGDGAGPATWTVLMLKLTYMGWRLSSPVDPASRDQMAQKLLEPDEIRPVVEFLYLHGDAGGWNWGNVGRVNGALLFPEALACFRKHM